MKQIFTLFASAFLVATASAQFTENFENIGALPSNCWQLTSTYNITTNQVISGSASIGTDPILTTVIKTPYLEIGGTSNVSFKYLLNNKLNNNSTRTVEIGTTDKYGNYDVATSFVLDKTTAPNQILSFDANLALASGTRRFTIRVTAASGDGNSYLLIDDLSVSGAALHYGTSPCNTAPVASNANYATFGATTYHGNLSAKASDDNAGENLTFSLVDASAANGNLVLNANGTFSFTPSGGFSGGMVSFTYKVTDNGYDPASSNTATVNITYPSQAPLPVNLTRFLGNVSNHKANFAWTVTQNEEGNYFEMEKSTDGKSFHTIAVVMNTARTGLEDYRYADAGFGGNAFYRLKMIGSNSSVSYSRTVVLHEAGETKTSGLTILQNPVLAAVNFEYTTTASGTASVNLYRYTGEKVFATQMSMQKGSNVATLKLDNGIAPGLYIMEMVNGAERSVAKLVKR